MWCGKVYSEGRVSHDPVRLQGLSDMRRPETAAELMQFLQAMNWLRTSLLRMAEVVAPLRLFFEELMAGAARRTKRVAKNALFPPPRGRRAASRLGRTGRILWRMPLPCTTLVLAARC